MKKSILFIITLLFATTVLAQRYYTPKIYVGGKAGTTFSQMSFSPDVKQSMLMGYMAGVSVKYTEENYFGLIAEFNIEQRGWQEDFEEAPFSYKRHLTYFQIPLLTHIYFGNDNIKGFVNLGPEIGFLIGDKITADFDYKNPLSVPNFPANRMTEQLYTDVKNKFDYGISGGIGLEYIIKKRHSIILEGRYYFGLGSIYPDKKKDTFSASRGTSILISLGYMYRFK